MTRATQALTAGLSGILFLTSSAYARADQKQECSAAYDATQSLRDEGKLVNAAKEALACRAAACPGFIREDCAQWLGEIEALVPTIVFSVEDAAGGTFTVTRFELDGRVLAAEGFYGKALPIDPGKHEVRVRIAGEGVFEKKIVARRGEKNRTVVLSFRSQTAGADRAPGVPEPGIRPSPPPNRVIAPPTTVPGASPVARIVEPTIPPKSTIPTWAWISGSAGLGLLVISAAVGGSALSSNNQVRSICGGDLAHCPEDKVGFAAPYASTRDENTRISIAFATIGGIAILSSVLGSIPTPSSSKSAQRVVSVAPFIYSAGAGFSAHGAF
jgi:hypothetical protein